MLSVILSSCPPDAAERIAAHLVEGRHAACVSVLPNARSTYRWQGQIQHDTEALLLVKVPTERVTACLEALRQVHPYTVPELVVLAAAQVAESYLAWAVAETQPQ